MNKNLNPDFVRQNKIVQHTVNGISRFLILWIIKNDGPIHGYAIIKKINNFFGNLIEEDSINKAKPSKIYPILKRMENGHLIFGEIRIKDNKKIKYYSITEEGEYLLNYIRESYKTICTTTQGSLFFNNFLNI